MTSSHRLLFPLLLLTCLAGNARAHDHELVLGSNGVLGLGSQTTSGLITLNQGTTISVGAAYNYAFSPYFQFGLNTSLFYLSAGTSSGTLFQLLGGPTLDVPFDRGDLSSAFFVTGMGGFITGSGTTTGAISGEIGVRARLVDHVSFRPSAGVLFLTSPSSLFIVLRPITFAFLF